MVDQAEIHRKAVSDKWHERRKAVWQLQDKFAILPDKEQAWDDLHRLTQDEDNLVRGKTADPLGTAFLHLPDKEQAWQDLHRLTLDEDRYVRVEAAIATGIVFTHIHDKEQAWVDLRRLTQDKNSGVRRGAVSALGTAFPHVSDKEQAWVDLHRLTQDKDKSVRLRAIDVLGTAFPHIPEKERAWVDLHRLTQDKKKSVRLRATDVLGTAFPHIPEKGQAWDVLHRLTQKKSGLMLESAADALGDAFSHIQDKERAWDDLHRLTQDKNSGVRWRVTAALGTVFPHIQDKGRASNDLHRLTQDKNSGVRWRVTAALGTAFPHIPDKERAWDDLCRLTQDKNSDVRWGAADALGTVFPHIPDKERAWDDLCRLTQDKNSDVRWGAADALGTAFQHIPDKEQAWKDLHRLSQDKDSVVRQGATWALGTVFQHIPDKEQAWRDLHRLSQDESCDMRRDVAYALGTVFQHIPNKERAWDDLHLLTQDESSYVRMHANHSLGRASIFKATEAESEESFMDELKKALKFFEVSSTDATHLNYPSSFCLPFYRSFYTITFEKAGAEAEVQKYLAEAKSASEGSKSKEQLLEAVENLANALTQVQNLQEADLDTIKQNLNTYRQYCDRAANLIGAVEEATPGAARVLRRGLPIIDERIKEIIREIQEKAIAVCKQTRGTPLEELGMETTRYAQELPIHDPLALMIALGNMGGIAGDWCEYIPGDKRIYACEQLKNLPNLELTEQGTALASVFKFINTNIHIPRIQTVHISDTQQEIVRLAVVQICFELTESFPFAVKNKNEAKPKIFSALNIASEEGANIVCLPELCLCEEWIKEIKEKYPDMTVIGGSFYKDGQNLCPVIMKSDAEIPSQPKMTPSASEYSGLMGPRMAPGDGIYKYDTQFGKFVILICRDFDNFVQYFRNMVEVDIIFCPAFNPASERFHKEADVHVEKIASYVLIANAGLYGGTSIFGRLNKNYFSTLMDRGCKDAGDLSYKLCEVKKGQEEVVIADFNLIYKSVQVPTPSDPNEEIRSVENIKKIPIQLKQ